MTQSLLWPAFSFVRADKGFSCSRLAHSLFHRLKSCSAKRHCKPARCNQSIRHVPHPDSMHAGLPEDMSGTLWSAQYVKIVRSRP